MAKVFRIKSITVQPDKLKKLRGKNNYDLISFKRLIAKGEFEFDGKTHPFQLVYEPRPDILQVLAKGSPISATAISVALRVQFARLSGLTEYPMGTANHQREDASFSNDARRDLGGFIHRLMEEKRFLDLTDYKGD